MTTAFKQRSLGVRAARASALCLLALVATLLQAREARAQWTTSGTNTTTTNNVGVGTAAPVTSLHVTTSTTAVPRGITNEQTSADGNAALYVFRKSRAGAAALNGDNIGNLYAEAFDGASFISPARLRFAIDGPVAVGSVPTSLQFFTGTGGGGGIERMRINSAGNIGIGATEPGSKMVISANAANPLAPNPANPSVLAPQDGTILHIVNADTQKTRVTIDSFSNTAGPSVSFRSGRGTLAAPTATLAGDALGIVYGGGFGVSRFHTAAKPAMWMVATENWTDTAAGSAIFFNTVKNGSTATVERMRISDNGNVGIGTTAPGLLNGVNFTSYIPLHIQAPAGALANIVLDSASPSSGFVLNDSSQPADNRIWAVSQAAGGGKLTFATYTDAGTTSNKVVIDRSGNMGVGIMAPTSKLHVDGDITVTGNINAKYQDVAEWVPSTQKLSAGTVVILDTGRDNHVLASRGSYDTRVAGVISEQPGLALGERGEGKVLVATTGRVKVRVDATRAPIRIGDLIVTSEVEGVAMKSEPVVLSGVAMHRPGTLIGKALGSLEKGTGEILVLLSLQ